MGCASSKEALQDWGRRPCSPGTARPIRCHSMPLRRSSAAGPITPHCMASTSSFCDLSNANSHDHDENMMKAVNDKASVLDRAKAWSKMIESRIPKPGHKTINTWELIEGLEQEPTIENMPFLLSLADFDADVISKFRRTLKEISPYNQSRLLHSPEPKTPPLRGIVKARISAFEQKFEEKKGKRAPPNSEKQVVVYLTSLRGVRRTFEDCWSIKMILQGYGVKVDERDLSIHAGFKDELHEIGMTGKSLPRVFADGKYLGGAEEVRRMHEAGELRRVLLDKCGQLGLMVGGCEACGDVRFVICEKCSGSCKLFVEEGDDECGEFRTCLNCNENGLVRCPICL